MRSRIDFPRLFAIHNEFHEGDDFSSIIISFSEDRGWHMTGSFCSKSDVEDARQVLAEAADMAEGADVLGGETIH